MGPLSVYPLVVCLLWKLCTVSPEITSGTSDRGFGLIDVLSLPTKLVRRPQGEQVRNASQDLVQTLDMQ